MITFTHRISAGQPVVSVKPRQVTVKGLYPRGQTSPLTLSPGINKAKTTKEKKENPSLYLAPAVQQK